MRTIVMDDFEALGIREIDWALVEAARNHRWSKVKRIILRGGNANVRDYTRHFDDLTILEMAIVAGEMEMVKWLVDDTNDENGGTRRVHDINAISKDGRTALHTAVETRNYHRSKLKDQQQQQLLHLEICKYLLSNGADLRLKTKMRGDTPLHVACYEESNDAVICYLITWLTVQQPYGDLLLINEKNTAGQTPLSLAVRFNSSATVRTMIETGGADVLAEVADGPTSLHYIIREGHWNVLQWLVETKRIDCDYSDKWGRGLMHIAASSGNTPPYCCAATGLVVLEWLIDNGFSYQVSSCDTNGKTPLHVASWAKAAALLVERAGADITARTNTGATPLHSALSTRYSLELIQWLVKHGGADVNAQDNHGRTPLHVAISIEDFEAAEWLTRHGGADLTIHDDEGRSPLDAALSECDDSLRLCGYQTPILKMLQQEVLERFVAVQTMASRGVFSCPVRRSVVIGFCP